MVISNILLSISFPGDFDQRLVGSDLPSLHQPYACPLLLPSNKRMASSQRLARFKLGLNHLSPGQWISFPQESSLLTGHVCSKTSMSFGRRRLRSKQALRDRPNGAIPPPPRCQEADRLPVKPQVALRWGTEHPHRAETCQGPAICERQSQGGTSGLLTPAKACPSPLHAVALLVPVASLPIVCTVCPRGSLQPGPSGLLVVTLGHLPCLAVFWE